MGSFYSLDEYFDWNSRSDLSTSYGMFCFSVLLYV